MLKPIFKKYGIKGTLSINNYSELVLTISKGDIDFLTNYNNIKENENSGNLAKNYIDVNIYHLEKHFSYVALGCLQTIYNIMNDGNYNNSDPSTDYFDIGFYISIKIGKWDKPYIYTYANEYI